MAKADPKDERIAELELALDAANKATATAETEAQRVTAIESELTKSREIVKIRDARIRELESELAEHKATSKESESPTIKGLDPSKAVQLKVSSVFANAITGARVYATAGEVICLKEALEETQRKVGTFVAIHPVSKDEFESAKKSGRAH